MAVSGRTDALTDTVISETKGGPEGPLFSFVSLRLEGCCGGGVRWLDRLLNLS